MAQLCYKCFNEYESGGICPHCGYDAGEDAGKYPHALKPGSILGGRYIVGRVLGQGGFGITYMAQDYDTKQIVAIKEHYPSAMLTRKADMSVSLVNAAGEADFLDGREKFLAEAKTISRFNGLANICDIYSYFEENGTAYFAMEYVQGQPLEKYMAAQGGPLSYSKALEVLQPVMLALSNIHAHGIIHRDIAPDNILVRSDGVPVLIDFGAARYSMGEKSMSLDVVLKHGFAPREQYARRGRQGAYTDVYAMAATFYYAITGVVPPDAVERLDEDRLQKPGEMGVKLPDFAERALLKALELDYSKRYQTMADFARALSSDERQPGKQKKAAKGLVVPVVAAIAAVAAASVFILGQDKGEPAAPQIETGHAAEVQEQLLPVEESPQPEEEQRYIAWSLSPDGTMSITAEGPVGDELLSPALTAAQAESITKISFSEGVTDITAGAFSGLANVKELSLPSSLQGIGEAAFDACPGLESISYYGDEAEWAAVSLGQSSDSFAAAELKPLLVDSGKGGENIVWKYYKDGTLYFSGTGPMYNTDAGTLAPWLENNRRAELKTVIIGEGITSTGERCFFRCVNVENVSLPSTLKRIGVGSFTDLPKLSEIILPEGLEVIETSFKQCTGLTSLVIPDSVTSLADESFGYCSSLESVTLSKNLKKVNGFSQCSSLKTIVLPDSVTHLESNSFSGCSSLESITLSANLVSVSEGAFRGCSSLESITVPEGIASLERSAFSGCPIKSVEYLGDELEWTQVEGSVEFASCKISFADK